MFLCDWFYCFNVWAVHQLFCCGGTRLNLPAVNEHLHPRVLHQAGEERLHHSQVHGEALCQEEMFGRVVAAPHSLWRSEGSRHFFTHPGLRWGSGPYGAHSSGQRTRQYTKYNKTCDTGTSPQALSTKPLIFYSYHAVISPHARLGFYANVLLFGFCYFRNRGRRPCTLQWDWWIEHRFTLSTFSLRTGTVSRTGTAEFDCR